MADAGNKTPENVPGKFYVDKTCIAAKFCVAVAPENFAMADGGYAYVKKQPSNGSETTQVEEAIDGCPVLAIGDDAK